MNTLPSSATLRVPVASEFLRNRLYRLPLALAAYWVFVGAMAVVHCFWNAQQPFPYWVAIVFSGPPLYLLCSKKWWTEPRFYLADQQGLYIGRKNGSYFMEPYPLRYTLYWSQFGSASLTVTTWRGLPCLLILKQGTFGIKVARTLVFESAEDCDDLKRLLEAQLAKVSTDRSAPQIA